jgi:hypothetical protein
MADPILVHVFFSGLIAFAPMPVGSSSVEELMVLLPDTHAYVKKTDKDCADKHWASIHFWQSKADCIAKGCKEAGDRMCKCELMHDRIDIGPVPLSISHTDLKKKPASSVPDQNSADDFAYVVNMENINHTRLHHFFREDDLPAGNFPPGLAARMRIPFVSLHPCDFAKVDKVHEQFHEQFDFKHRQTAESPVHSQALAASMMAVTKVRNDSQGWATLTLISADGEVRNFKLVPMDCNDGKCVEVLIMNERKPLPEGDKCLIGGIGWDFDFFFDLAEADHPRLLPHSGSGTSKEIKSLCTTKLFPEVMTASTNSRPICPMATFFQ